MANHIPQNTVDVITHPFLISWSMLVNGTPCVTCWKTFLVSHFWLCHLFNEDTDDVIKWKHFPRYWPFVRGIHRSPVNSPHKGQWRGTLMVFFICVWINGWVNQSWGWWLQAPSRPLWHHCNVQAPNAWNNFPCQLLRWEFVNMMIIHNILALQHAFVCWNNVAKLRSHDSLHFT